MEIILGRGTTGVQRGTDVEQLRSWIGAARPRMWSVQSSGCAPIVRAWEQGDEYAAAWDHAHTYASGLRVPKAVGDFLNMLGAADTDFVSVETLDRDAGFWETSGGGNTCGACALQKGCLLASDRDGLPLAAPNQWLAMPGDAPWGGRQVQWLATQDFGKPLVSLLPRVAPAEELVALQEQGLCWLARASGSTRVIVPATGEPAPLSRLEPGFGVGETVTFRGQPALRSVAEMPVLVATANGTQLRLRCVVSRIVCAATGAVLQQAWLLANLTAEVAPVLTEGQRWGAVLGRKESLARHFRHRFYHARIIDRIGAQLARHHGAPHLFEIMLGHLAPRIMAGLLHSRIIDAIH